MPGERVTISELFDNLRAENEAAWNDPVAVARREARSQFERRRIETEIASGIRDADGELDPNSDAARAIYDFGDEPEEDEPEEDDGEF
jgi:hypothetical protein